MGIDGFDMDAVITYVDGCDPYWLEDYSEAVGGSAIVKRYRDWGFLRFLFRGIEKHLPFIDKVHLVVSRDSQVPAWVDRERTDVVLHSDFIPHEYLPTFNSTTIEMFLHRIPGLSDRYIYFNDDTLPVADMAEDDFFLGDKCAIGFSKHMLATNQYKKHVRNSDRIAREALGIGRRLFFVRAQHSCTPMIKSECEVLFEKMEGRILSSLSPLRSDGNLNQYVFLDYLYYQGKAISRRLPCKHFSLAASSVDRIASYIDNPDRKVVCINDVRMPDEKFIKCRETLLSAMEKRYPVKSRFEL